MQDPATGLLVLWGYLGTVWHLIPLGIAGVISWSVWILRVFLSRRAKPIVNDFRTTTSVVVPCYREDADIVDACLTSWLAQGPHEVIIVVDLADTEVIHRLAARQDPRVRVVPFQHHGKRSALGVGIRKARGEVLVLVDSDTYWLPGLLAAVQVPFADPRVGGVGTRQNVLRPETSVWRRLANWMVDVRYVDYVPAQGNAGAVVCLSGRTAAYRRSAVMPVLANLEDEFFFGRRCVAGDDGRLTWLVLASGFRTVHQINARALSGFPDSFKAFVKQRVRWSRNSYRCYLTALWKGWLWKQPLIAQISVLQILLTPFTMALALTYAVLWCAKPGGWGFAVALGWMLAGRGIRGLSHLRRNPKDIVLLPLMVLTVAFVALPIKAYALVTMNKQGWLTRRSDLVGGEGQGGASLQAHAGGVHA
jgi:hyaluronan synthase